MNWFEITLIDGNRGLINLNNIVDIWKGLNDEYATISQVNGEEIKQITFGKEKKVYPIRTSFGLNILEVDNDGVRVIEASCPDKLDVKFGKINKVGQAIICMPNRLVIQIKSRQNNDLDVVN